MAKENVFSKKAVEELFTFLSKNLEVESVFLTPFPDASINLISLLDKIADLRGISHRENGEEFNEVMNKLQERGE